MRELGLFRLELQALCNRYKIKNVALAGEYADKLIGLFCADAGHCPAPFPSLISCYHNTARLYQAARERTMRLYDNPNLQNLTKVDMED